MTLAPIQRRAFPSSGDKPLGVRMRPDLIAVGTSHKHEAAVVVKDPIAMKYHRLRPDEFFLLTLLKDEVTLESLREQYEKQFRPRTVKLNELNELLFRFHQLGLTLADALAQGDRLQEKQREERRGRWMEYVSCVLFIRFPGVDPEPLLTRLYPRIKPLFSPVGMTISLAIGVLALLTLAAHWDRFVVEFPEMEQWIQLRAVLILAAVIGVTKVFHELGHALVCKHFGGECHQIGPMLLVFTPALYCDTSDSWTLPNRFQRAAVGMAGIGTEILVAAIATLVWAVTGPSLTHYIAMNVVLVCSVSTLLFNANPLLRYDGYYVWSDLFDVPNLSQKSQRLLVQQWSRLLFGIEPDNEERLGAGPRFWLSTYGIAAFVYRWSLTLVILWFLLLILRPYRLESVGFVLVAFTVSGLVFSIVRTPIQFLTHPGHRRKIKMKRMLISAMGLFLVAVAACWPFPSGEMAPGRIVPRCEVPIYVSTSGHLDHLEADVGQVVEKGTVIVTLANPDVEYEFVRAIGRVESQRELVLALRKSQSTLPDAANELPGAEALLAELERQLETRQNRQDALTIKSPETGRLIAAPQQTEIGDSDNELTLTSWGGDPTEARNRGCYINSGTELYSVVVDDRWDAELIVSANAVQRIEIGNRVKLVLESKPETLIHAVVSDISVSRWNPEDNHDRRDDRQSARLNEPMEASYVVRIELDSRDTSLLTGAEVSARIEAKPISLAGRTTRFLNRLLRFR